MSSKTYMVFDQENLHEYNIVVEDTDEGTKLSLFLSDGEQWNSDARGQLELSMVDNGNGVKFSKKLKNLDYSDVIYVRLLLGLEQHLDGNPKNREKYKIVESKTIVEL